MIWARFLEFLHVAAAFWLVTGLLGRTVVMAAAERSTDLNRIRALLPVARVFENGMVQPASGAVLIAGLLAAWLGGWPILGFLQGGSANWVLVSLLVFISIFPVIRFIFVPGGKRFEQALAGAESAGQVTPELTAAFHDPAVRAGHIYELAALVVIIFLMVAKPF